MSPEDRLKLLAYKGGCCCHCGKSVEEVLREYGTVSRVFEFNHVRPAEKHRDYDNLVRRVISREVLDEIDKCVLLCRFCHGILHAQNTSATLTLTSQIRGRNVSQVIPGQIITKLEAGSLSPKITFLTDAKIRIIPYRVHRGGRRPNILTSGELENGPFLQYMADTRAGPQFALSDLSGRELFRVKKLNDALLEAKARICFSLIEAELRGDGDGQVIWVRRGRAIFRKGGIAKDGFYTFQVKYSEIEKTLDENGPSTFQVVYPVIKKGPGDSSPAD